MKPVLLTLVILLTGVGPVLAQPPAHHDMHHGQMPMMMETPWKELNGVHSLLHASHSALMRSGDLAPARTNAGALAKAADVWAASTPPAECHHAVDLGDKVTAFAADTRAFDELVAKGGSDDEVKGALGKIHDQFQTLHRACMPMDQRGPHAPPPARGG